MTKKQPLIKAIKLIIFSIYFFTTTVDAQEWKFAFQSRNNMSAMLVNGEFSNGIITLTKQNDAYYLGLSSTSVCLRLRATKVEYTKEYLIITPNN